MAKRIRLTKKRQKWVKGRSVVMRGKPLRNSITAEDRYAKKLEALTRRMTDDVSRQIKKLFESPESTEYFGEDASIGSKGRILVNQLNHKYIKLFSQMSKPYAMSMINAVDRNSKTNMHSSLEKLTGGMSIKTDFISEQMKDMIAASVAENVILIKSIPEQYLAHVGGAVMRTITQPNQGGIAELIEHIDGMLVGRDRFIRNKARNIAYDQTRKMYNRFNAGRMQAVGLNKYEWIHSGAGQQPREFHRDVLNGQIFDLDDPPIIDEDTGERGIPSQLINCRCTMRPVLEFEDGEET